VFASLAALCPPRTEAVIIGRHPRRVLDEAPVEIVILSDRAPALATLIRSICAKTTASVSLHLVLPDPAVAPDEDELRWRCGADLRLRILKLDELTASVERSGLRPIAWKENDIPGDKPSSARPDDWDRNEKHNSAFNQLRFYLPELPEFRNVSQLVFFDDDVLINGDVRELWEHPQHKILSGGCLNFVGFNECNRFVGSFNMSYNDNAYLLGIPPIVKKMDEARCTSKKTLGCVGPDFYSSWADEAAKVGIPTPYTLEWLSQSTAWNFGVNKFDLTRWRELDFTRKFLDLLAANKRHGWVQTSSIAYGLGLAWILFADEFECLDPVKFSIIHGFGYCPAADLAGSDVLLPDMSRYWAMHWAGPVKAWDLHPDFLESVPAFMRYAPEATQIELADRAQADLDALLRERKAGYTTSEQRHVVDDPAAPVVVTPSKQPKTLFLLWTDSPNGRFDWLNEALIQFDPICTPGTVAVDPARGVVAAREFRQYPSGPRQCIHKKSACDWGVLADTLRRVERDRTLCDAFQPGRHPLGLSDEMARGAYHGSLHVACAWVDHHPDAGVVGLPVRGGGGVDQGMAETMGVGNRATHEAAAYDAYLVRALTRSSADVEEGLRRIAAHVTRGGASTSAAPSTTSGVASVGPLAHRRGRVTLPCFCDATTRAVGLRFKLVDDASAAPDEETGAGAPWHLHAQASVPRRDSRLAALLEARGARAIVVERTLDAAGADVASYRRARDDFLNELGLPELRISAEDCEARPVSCVTRIVEHLGVPIEGSAPQLFTRVLWKFNWMRHARKAAWDTYGAGYIFDNAHNQRHDHE